MKYLFFILVPIGLYIIIISIKKVRGFVKAKMIYEMPVTAIDGSFTFDESGKYDIWLSGKKFSVSPIYKLNIKLKNNETDESVPMSKIIFRTTVNGFKDARVKLYTFGAESGSYNISLADSAETRENIINNRGIDYNKFSIQIRENVQSLSIFLSILGIILGFIAIDVGLALPLLGKF